MINFLTLHPFKRFKTIATFAVPLAFGITSATVHAQSGDAPFDPYSAYKGGQHSDDTELQPELEPEKIALPESEPSDTPIELHLPTPNLKPELILEREPDLTPDELPPPAPTVMNEQFEVMKVPSLLTAQEEKIEPADAIVTPEFATAPFYLSANDYLSARGQTDAKILQLQYDVKTRRGNEELDQIVTLGVSPDFISIETRARDSSTDVAVTQKIYDFKLNRILNLTPSPSDKTRLDFTNSSLFAAAQRKSSAVITSTARGSKDIINLGNGASIDAFWVESAASYSDNDHADSLETSNTLSDGVSVFEASYNGAPALTLELSNEPYPDPAMSDVMSAFAHLDLPIHPVILEQFYAAPSPIKSMTVHMKAPQSQSFSNSPAKNISQTQSWTLISQVLTEAPFPLPENAMGVLEQAAASPIALVLSQAAKGTAMGGKDSLADISDKILVALDDNDQLTAWLEGQRYLSYGTASFITACPDQTVCDAMEALEKRADVDPDVATLSKAFADARLETGRVRAVQTLSAWINDNEPSAIVLRMLAMTRASISKSTAIAAQVDNLNIESLMITSLAKDPYDQLSYIGLSQYYAANKDFERSWDMTDAMRNIWPEAKKRAESLNNIEDRIKDQAPGYFLQNFE